ncbi:MAG: IS110 family transposase [Candidatus Cloacimonetes bacterium]|nr:IS110 family transposase [Candidatus Cloacimonadota bacterium]
MSNTLFVGADIDAKKVVICFLNSDGNKLGKVFSIPNSTSGTTTLAEKITSIYKKNNITEIKIGCEATSLYSFHFLNELGSNENLLNLKTQVFQINPRMIRNFKKSFPDNHKTDIIDAFVIADRLRFGRLPQPYVPFQNHLPLQRLTRFRFHLVHTINREKNYLFSNIFLKFSAYRQSKTFSNDLGATSIAVLTEFLTPDEIAQTSVEDLTDFIMKHGKNKFTDPDEVVKKIKAMARESYRIRPELAKSVNLILATTLINIKALQKSLKHIDKAISEEIKAFPNTLQSIPGIGPVYTAGIIAEIGDINRFENEAKVARFAGLAWKKSQTADYEADETPFFKNSNKYLRYYLVQAANSLKNHNAEYRKFYDMKFKEALKHKHKRALVLTARKFVRLAYALLKSKRMYQCSY